MGPLKRLRKRDGLSPAQEALLQLHRDRAGRLVEGVLRRFEVTEQERWQREGRRSRRILDSPEGERLLAEPALMVSAAITALADLPNRITYFEGVAIVEYDGHEMYGGELLSNLVRRKLPWTRDDIDLMFAISFQTPQQAQFGWTLVAQLRACVAASERFARDNDIEPLRPLLEGALREAERMSPWPEATTLRTKIHQVLDGPDPGPGLSIVDGDEWGEKVKARLRDTKGAELIAHLSRASSARPTGAWLKKAETLLNDRPDVVRTLLDSALETEPRVLREFEFEGRRYAEYAWLTDGNANIVRGAVWALPLLRPPWAVEVLGQLVERALAHSKKVANACVYSLGRISTPDAVQELSRLHSQVKDRGFQKQVQAGLDAAAEELGVSQTQLLERVVPTHGLDGEGRREVPVEDWTAVLEVEPTRVVTRWRNAVGEEQKTKPTALKDSPSAGEVTAAATELRKALATERARLESLLPEEASWTLSDWRSAYLEHPLVGVLARGLLWRFDDQAALGSEAPAKASEVRLWHPAISASEEVQELRQALVERELVQPFKQAFREIYVLAPAELETEVYSNRFAAHVLHYPQTYALLKERGWGGNALGPWDGGYETAVFREFRSQGLRVEWWLENANPEQFHGLLADFASTDQVRFLPLERRDREPIPLREVPPLVFSEAMRDIDLFVGVSSIGADPVWIDRGLDRRFDDYWSDFAFGDLDEAARVRRSVLAGLIPKLRIADRLELDEKFLRVRGDLGSYKIHLRSGNILMEPDDRYLCIVPAPAAERPTKKVFLPFEDDRRLNVIISKAFLLANDRKIDDPTILAQLNRS